MSGESACIGEHKVINLTGQAAMDYAGGKATKKRRTAKKKQDGGVQGIASPNGVAATAAPVSSPMTIPTGTPMVHPPRIHPAPSSLQHSANQYAVVKGGSQPPATPVPAPPIIAGVTAGSIPNKIGGAQHDVRQIKVELKKKQDAKKVQLHPKKADGGAAKKGAKTRKARKVMLGVSSLHKRMTRAKKMHKKAAEMPLDKLKEELIKKKLIKPTSKAPESVLRQIAADAQIVAGKAL